LATPALQIKEKRRIPLSSFAVQSSALKKMILMWMRTIIKLRTRIRMEMRINMKTRMTKMRTKLRNGA